MAKFPEPPEVTALSGAGIEAVQIDAGTRLWRVYAAAGPHPAVWNQFRYFGPTDSRFDQHMPPPHDDPDKGVCYVGASAPLCLAERFQRDRHIDRSAGRPRLAGFDLARPLRLHDLRGLWPTRAGASQAISSGTRARSRRWAIALYEAMDVDGLCYRSSMYGGETAVALWESARTAVPARPLIDLPLSDPRLTMAVARAARSIGYGVA